MEKIDFKQGQYVFRAGDGAGYLFLLIKGEIGIFLPTNETKEPNLATGTNAQQFGSAYESIGQMKADMADPRYATDSAFRKMVADKVSRSKVI